jgi:arsenite methyltransferase
VRVVTADMRAIPLADDGVDLVVSSLAIHNVPDQPGRDRALAEIARVLRPGGVVVIQDMRYVDRYAEQLRAQGVGEVAISGLQFRIFPPVRYVTGIKRM